MAERHSDGEIGQVSTPASEKLVFIDTNCFIQARDLKDLPWSELFPKVEKLVIIVAPVVIEELDEFKSNRDGRRRDRARSALTLIEAASSASNFEYEIRSSPIQILLKIEHSEAIDWTSFPILDKSRPDDRILASMINSDHGAVLLSHDVGPIVRARIVGREAIKIPQGWLLPEGSDGVQRELQKTLKELDILRSAKPRIQASFSLPHQLICPKLEPLSLRVQNLMAIYATSIWPKEKLFAHAPIGGGFSINILSQSEIDKYNSKYEVFEQSVRNYIASLHQIVEYTGNVRRTTIHLKNDSGTTAEQLIIEYEITKNGVFFADCDDAIKHMGVAAAPEPPEPPRSVLDNMMPARFVPRLPDWNRDRNPICFYWLQRPDPGDKKSAVQCAQFRPQREWEDPLWIMPLYPSIEAVEVTVAISASNLHEPLHIKRHSSAEWNIVIGQML